MQTRTKTLQSRFRPRGGFTLVELLVVITIIGAIAGLSIPAIGVVMRNVRLASMKAEMSNIETGIDSYYTKHGDYPPDFSDWGIVRRHYLKIFPDIATSELTLLFRMCDNIADNDASQLSTTGVYNSAAMNRAEALVWCLGGFSSDPQFPFTGAGGPLVMLDPNAASALTNPANFEYNPTRNAPEVQFEPDQLSVAVPQDLASPRSFANRFASNDDAGTATDPIDVFPSYVLREDSSPVVYFDSRTYAFTPDGVSYNGYLRATQDSITGFDGVRPVFSANPGFVPTSGTYGSTGAALTGWQFENPKTFQLLAPGLDGLYGELIDSDPTNDPTPDIPAYFHVSGGLMIPDGTASAPAGLLNAGVSRFDVTAFPALRRSENPMRDNLANFIDSTFEDLLE